MAATWSGWLAEVGPFEAFWTLSFAHPYSDRRALQALWEFTKFINRKLFGPRWMKKGIGMNAIVIAERHAVSHEMRGRLHFHVLVRKQTPSIDVDRLSLVITNAADWLKDELGRRMTNAKRVDARSVWDAEGIACYLSKDLETPVGPAGETLFFLTPSGLDGVVLQQLRPKELAQRH